MIMSIILCAQRESPRETIRTEHCRDEEQKGNGIDRKPHDTIKL